MKKNNEHGLIKGRTKELCKLHHQLAQFVTGLDRLPDAREAQQNTPKSAPPQLLPMVF